MLCCLVLGMEAFPAQAAVEIIPDGQPAAVFGQGKRLVRVSIRNTGDRAVQANLRWRLYQASSSTLVPLGETRSWRSVPLGAAQTVVETPEVDLPQVRGESAFHVVWFDGEKKLGATPLRVFPEGLLHRLTALAGDAPVGLIDPEGHFRPAMAGLRVEELKEAEDISASEARLILTAPMNPTNRVAGLSAAIRKKVSGGAGIVWVQAPMRWQPERLPSIYLLDEGTGRVIITSAETVDALAESPRAQLNLLRMAELAVGKAKLEWPADSEP